MLKLPTEVITKFFGSVEKIKISMLFFCSCMKTDMFSHHLVSCFTFRFLIVSSVKWTPISPVNSYMLDMTKVTVWDMHTTPLYFVK